MGALTLPPRLFRRQISISCRTSGQFNSSDEKYNLPEVYLSIGDDVEVVGLISWREYHLSSCIVLLRAVPFVRKAMTCFEVLVRLMIQDRELGALQTENNAPEQQQGWVGSAE